MSEASNKRDTFVLCVGRCSHKWVVPSRAFVAACPVCGDIDRDGKHAKCEPVHVNLAAVRDKVRAMGASEPRDAAAVLLAARRRQRAEEAELER